MPVVFGILIWAGKRCRRQLRPEVDPRGALPGLASLSVRCLVEDALSPRNDAVYDPPITVEEEREL